MQITNPATLATVGVAALIAGLSAAPTPAHAAATCPPGNVCAFNPDGNTVWQAGQPFNISWTSESSSNVSLIQNNTDPAASSEGTFVLELGGICVYVVNTKDEQNPDTSESNPSDRFNAVAIGPKAEVDANAIVVGSDCKG